MLVKKGEKKGKGRKGREGKGRGMYVCKVTSKGKEMKRKEKKEGKLM